jgi:hypothetical protein
VVETIRVFTFFPTALFALLADARIWRRLKYFLGSE